MLNKYLKLSKSYLLVIALICSASITESIYAKTPNNQKTQQTGKMNKFYSKKKKRTSNISQPAVAEAKDKAQTKGLAAKGKTEAKAIDVGAKTKEANAPVS